MHLMAQDIHFSQKGDNTGKMRVNTAPEQHDFGAERGASWYTNQPFLPVLQCCRGWQQCTCSVLAW